MPDISRDNAALLLISNSGTPPFAHYKGELSSFLTGRRTIGFVSAASAHDEDIYFERVRDVFESSHGADLVDTVLHVEWDGRWERALEASEAVVVGGGNTYLLLERLTESGLLAAIGERVAAGLPYIGSSAGSNVAGPNILTTNDWNVVGSTHFQSFGFVPFNVNPHYREPSEEELDGENRHTRIAEYNSAQANPVVAIEEGGMLHVENGHMTVRGAGRARVFSDGRPPRWLPQGSEIEVSTAALALS